MKKIIHAINNYFEDMENPILARSQVPVNQNAFRYLCKFLNGARMRRKIDSRSIFEHMLKKKLAARYAMSCSSGTQALHVALAVCGIKIGDEVITNPFAHISDIAAILKCGAKPVLANVDNDRTFDMADLKKKITCRTKAVIVVHLDGFCDHLPELLDLRKKYGFYLIEDACQALCSKINIEDSWRYLGCVGDIGVFSFGFGTTKPLKTFGGGLLVTQNHRLGRLIGTLMADGEYTAARVLPGYNCRLDYLRCAVGMANLLDLDQTIENNKTVWKILERLLTPFGWLQVIRPVENSVSNYGRFKVWVSDPRIAKALKKALGLKHKKNPAPNAYVKFCQDGLIDKKIRSINEHLIYVPMPSKASLGRISGAFKKVDNMIGEGEF